MAFNGMETGWHGSGIAVASLSSKRRGWSLVHVTWDDVTTRALETIEHIRRRLAGPRGVARNTLTA